MDWDQILERLSITGITLLVLGIWISMQASTVCRLVLKEHSERFITPMKMAGLALAILGAIILLDFIPGL